MNSINYPLVFIVAFFGSPMAAAASLSPFYTRNYAPLVQFFGVPVLPDVDALQDRANQWSVHAAYSSHFAAAIDERDLVIIDGESYHYTMQYQRRIDALSSVQLSIPYLVYRGGIMDGFIEAWHDTFSLPQSGRQSLAKNRLQFYYEQDGHVVFNASPDASGLGDISLSWQRSLEAASTLAVNHQVFIVNVKLPSGSQQNWLGSGGTDLALGLAQRRRQEWMGKPVAWFLSSGFLLPGKAYYLSDRQRSMVLYGGLGWALQWQPALVFKAQLDMHSAFYNDTDMAALGQAAAQLTLGGDVLLRGGGRIELGVSEDLVIDASPDVTFNVGVVFNF